VPGVLGRTAANKGLIMARVGVDFGGVIVKSRTTGEDTSLRTNEGEEVAQDGVFAAITEINSICDGQLWIVSKAGPRMQARTRAWLEAVDFFSRTGLDADHLRFCVERHEKEPICRELKISHFVDDRVHIMQILRHTVPTLYLFADETQRKSCPPWATLVSDWAQLVEFLRSTT
jgi:hypothetical protein